MPHIHEHVVVVVIVPTLLMCDASTLTSTIRSGSACKINTSARKHRFIRLRCKYIFRFVYFLVFFVFAFVKLSSIVDDWLSYFIIRRPNPTFIGAVTGILNFSTPCMAIVISLRSIVSIHRQNWAALATADLR